MPPKTPIIFWIEKTVPFKYRKPIRDGIAEWNKAFEQAGWLNAIEVRQQPDDATWDPEDINYNTFRWITANAGFAMGPVIAVATVGPFGIAAPFLVLAVVIGVLASALAR